MPKRPTPPRRRLGAKSRTAPRSYGAKRPAPSRRRLGAKSRTAPRSYGAHRPPRPRRSVGDRAANIILIGFMGSGKTTVGRALARRLRWRFVDLDRAIEVSTGRRIAELFRLRGEARFRLVEHREVRKLAALRHVVVAAGGGAPVHAPNRPWLRRSGLLVHLRVPVGVLARRLRAQTGRPLLASAGADPRRLRTLIARLLRARRAAYAVADVTVRAGGARPAVVAGRVERASRPWRRAHGL